MDEDSNVSAMEHKVRSCRKAEETSLTPVAKSDIPVIHQMDQHLDIAPEISLYDPKWFSEDPTCS